MPGNCVLGGIKAIDRSFPGYRSIAFFISATFFKVRSAIVFSPSFTACHAPRRTDGNRIFLACIAYQADWCTSVQDTRYAPFPPRERDITRRTFTPCQRRFFGSCVFVKDRFQWLFGVTSVCSSFSSDGVTSVRVSFSGSGCRLFGTSASQ